MSDERNVAQELVSWEVVAAQLGTKSRYHVDKARLSGLLPACRVGRQYRYHPDDVRALVEKLRNGVSL